MDFNSKHKSSEIEEILDSVGGKQEKLVSGTNIKTINGESILGTGDITIKERELEKYDTDKSWSIVASNLLELLIEYGNAPDGTKAIVVADANSLYGVNLFDALMGNVDGVVDVFTNLNAFTLEISAIDTSVELPVSITSDVRVEVPFNDTVYIDMGADMASIYHISVQTGFTESVWGEGYWHGTSYMIGNKMPLSRFENLDDNAFAGLMAIAPALIVDFVGTKTITEYVKNGDDWEVWSEGESGLNTKLNAWLEQIAQLLPTKTSQLENDSNFITSDGLKTINGESILGSGDIEISGGSGSGEDIRYFTDFTVEDFIEGVEGYSTIREDTTALLDAVRNNKVICMPFRAWDKGYKIAYYKLYDESGEGEISIYIELDGVKYEAFSVGGGYLDASGLVAYVTKYVFEPNNDAEVYLEVRGNTIYEFSHSLNYLCCLVGTSLNIPSTIRFCASEDFTLEASGIYWANGVIPQFEGGVLYELSLSDSRHGITAVLTPFKQVE